MVESGWARLFDRSDMSKPLVEMRLSLLLYRLVDRDQISVLVEVMNFLVRWRVTTICYIWRSSQNSFMVYDVYFLDTLANAISIAIAIAVANPRHNSIYM